jgi:uncharacterized protein (TIGR02265 family)
VFYGSWANGFLGSARASGDFAETLRKAGYDPLNPADKYPAAVFVSLLALVRRGLFPDLPPQEGYWQVGRRHLTSYFEKGFGRLQGLAFPFLGPERVIKGLEEFARSGNNFVKAVAAKECDRCWRVAFRHTGGLPGEYIAGALDYGLERARTPPTRKIVVANSDPAKEQFDLEITW